MANPNGNPRGGPGRPRGTPNKATAAGREFCQRILNSRTYVRSLMRRMRNDTLDPVVERSLHDHGWGKPVEFIDLEVTDRSHETMTAQQLAARAEVLSRQLRDVPDADDVALPAARNGKSGVH